MPSGRKHKPTEAHRLEGTLRPDRHGSRSEEPKAEGSLGEPPVWLTEGQKVGWRYALEHAPTGVLGLIDRTMLAVWVVAEDLHRQACEKVAGVGAGLIIRSTSKGEPIQNPYLAILNKQAQILIKAASELGFSPAGRPRLAKAQPGATDEFGALGNPDEGDHPVH